MHQFLKGALNKMSDDESELAFDTKDPIGKFVHICGIDRLPQDICLPLVALHAADLAVRQILGAKEIYFLDDTCVQTILNTACVSDSVNCTFQLVQLSKAQLIYRFTAARKFAIQDGSVKQLRINSWGRRLIEQRLLDAFETEHQACLESVRGILMQHRLAYADQMARITAPINAVSAQAIRRGNDSLPLRMVI